MPEAGAHERQHGIYPFCHQSFSIEEMEGDHITPWCGWQNHNRQSTNALQGLQPKKGGK